MLEAAQIKQWALEEGFDDVGIAAYHLAEQPFEALRCYLNAAYHGSMRYMERYTELRRDPRLLLENCNSIIVLFSRYTNVDVQDPQSPRIARYAYGNDYHTRLRQKLKRLIQRFRLFDQNFHYRAFVDSAPVFEKYWAAQAGLGWIGKNTLLVHPEYGSFAHLAVILSDAQWIPDSPIENGCGNCHLCLDQCPTKALYQAYHMNASRCLSYASVESKDYNTLATELCQSHCLFGCDRCQSKCPYNHESKIKPLILDDVKPLIRQASLKQWLDLDIRAFEHHFKDSPLSRQGFEAIRHRLVAMRSQE